MPAAFVPSTHWKEIIAPDEAQRYAGYAAVFAAIQAHKSASYGPGRALHRKQLVGARATLEVLAEVPDFARYGLFAHQASYGVLVRLSNGGLDKASDRAPDIRGFALRVLGVSGAAALGNGAAKSQDFTLINQEQFAFARSDEFVAFVEAAARGNAALLKYLLKRYGWLGGPKRLLQMVSTVGRPFGGFATEPVFSAVPMACGPYAVRVRLLPAAENGVADPAAKEDWGADFAARLARQSLHWSLQLQPFVNEGLTPVEDASVNWPTPYSTVARLTLPQQDCASAAGQALAKMVEADVFDPWQALAEHRPLGDVQRARRVVYFESQKGRSTKA